MLDKEEDREVTAEEGKKYANSIDASFAEVSAKHHELVAGVFHDSSKHIYKALVSGKLEPTPNNGITSSNNLIGLDSDDKRSASGPCSCA
eukprot:CAMPEP_0117424888 /NCGR_PEP_ID=MMETSP0758-20121206/5246_1 /TAXON_ID=63605 /ORGANISM="Percolomonas cosmopolitus, Strain AE-1 (ATCC 50343)" /LENGTH=89 /DNA_ID=CAMNT_0005208995 /DNA_START=370 /DNA_END=639 /DNA_ORIENTATION=-